LPERVHRNGRARAGSGRGGASFHDSSQSETNGNATFTTTIDVTASDGSVAASHDTTHLLWNGVQGWPHGGDQRSFRGGGVNFGCACARWRLRISRDLARDTSSASCFRQRAQRTQTRCLAAQ
jgi:hypothetical protein